MRSIAIVGASLAGLGAARALRRQGYDGTVTIVGDERHRPYDRPPLSKDLLLGVVTPADLALESDDEDLALDWRLGQAAVGLDPSSRRVQLADGGSVAADGVVLATGATPRGWPGTTGDGADGVHVLRTVDDALALRAQLTSGAKLVVIGAGFLGAEVAASASALGVEVTVLELAPVPLAGALGERMGGLVGGWHARHGVTLRCGVAVTAIDGAGEHVRSVTLSTGESVPADVVLVAVGVTPNTAWLRGTGLDLVDGVPCDPAGATVVPNVVAVGDCAAWYDAEFDLHRRVEHWDAARERPATAVATLLAGSSTGDGAGGGRAPAPPARARAPYFWSDQYGMRLQVAGHPRSDDDVAFEIGDEGSDSFLAVYRRGGHPVAVLGVDQSREFTRWRRALTPTAVRTGDPS